MSLPQWIQLRLLRNNVVLFRRDECALVIENAPALRAALPDGRAAAETVSLAQCVRKKICLSAESAKAEIGTLPAGRGRVDGRILFKNAEDEVPTVATA
jgi:hypothetical protein